MICDLEGCDVEFKARGLKKYYCKKHKKHADWNRQDDKKIKANSKAREQKQKARSFAALHCVHYSSCICQVRINCLDCQRADIKHNAWQHEPGTLYMPNEDLHTLGLPSAGRSE